jgi:polyferredoxin
MLRTLALALLVALGVLVAILWGLNAIVIYLVFAFLLLGVVYTLGFFGEWIQRTSRGRFNDDARRR